MSRRRRIAVLPPRKSRHARRPDPGGIYQLSDDERAGIERGLADMCAGRFATDGQIDAIFRKARSFRAGK
jgi:hypothetical protein